MTAIRTSSALVALALVLAAAPALAAAAAPNSAATASTPALPGLCGPALPALLIVTSDSAATPLLEPLPEALQPHCCSQQEVDACRAGCKDVGPGCKGQVTCRAGECVCTCSCP